MIGSGEAESRAVAGAVKSAISQSRLDAGVNITGLLVDIDTADSVDYRQHFMCWHLTRVFRPSLTEKVPPAVVRRVVDQETARIGSLNRRAWSEGSPLLDLSVMQLHREFSGWTAVDSDDAAMVGAGARRQHPRWTRATSNTRGVQVLCDRVGLVGSATG